MKKNIISFCCSFLIGGICAYVFLNSFLDKVTYLNVKEDNAYAFQVGVFQDKDKALQETKKYQNSIVVQDGEYYRIYLNIVKNDEVKEKMLNYYQSQQIQVYPKKISVSKDFLTTLEQYEKMIKDTDTTIMESVSKEILKSYETMKI